MTIREPREPKFTPYEPPDLNQTLAKMLDGKRFAGSAAVIISVERLERMQDEACGLAFDHGRLLAEVERLRAEAARFWPRWHSEREHGLATDDSAPACPTCGKVNPYVGPVR